jgi:8-oxo-dGTP diphosphatase
MKTVKVVAAVITKKDKNSETLIFATQRGYGEFKDGWEFPGGKIESGESPQEALKREIKEELDTEISVGNFITTVEYDYPTFHLSMDCFLCEVISGSLILREHEDSRWLKKSELDSVAWLPADIDLVKELSKLEHTQQHPLHVLEKCLYLGD